METEVGEEWGLLRRRIDVVVECELGEREVVDPIVLLVRDVRAQVRLERLVGALGEAVSLWVKRSRMLVIDL